MKNLSSFFGNITILDLVELGLAVGFIVFAYKKYKKHMAERLIRIEEKNDRMECNKLRDCLLRYYRFYTNKEKILQARG